MSEHYRILTGENAAEAYLVARGAKVRERNFRTRAGEIDLIVELDGCIVFVEVKRRSTPRLGRPMTKSS